MGKCSKTKGKARKIECYVKSSAKWTAGKLKSGVERIGSFSGEQGSKHKYGFGLFLLAVIVISATGGAAFLLTSPVSNPNPSDITYTRTYTLSNGTVVVDNGRISGTLMCVVKPSASAATEVATWTITQFGISKSILTPYWITGMVLNVYSGQVATGTPVQTVNLAVDSTTYVATMQKWVNDYFALVTVNPADMTKWILGVTPTANPIWTASFDTRNLANGIYTFQVAVTWDIGVPMLAGITVPTAPSLASSSGKAYFLSFFGLGEDVPMEEVALPIAFLVIVVIAVVVILILKRRS